MADVDKVGPGGVNVDWSLLKQPDYAGDYANAFQLGRQQAQQTGEAAANQQFATDPTGAANAMQPYDPAQAAAMRSQTQNAQDRAAGVTGATDLANGDTAGAMRASAATGNIAQVSQLATAQKSQLLGSVEKIDAMLNGLSQVDPTQRLSVAQHIASLNPAAARLLGIDPANVTADDVSDIGLAQHHAALAGIERAAMTPGERASADKPQVVGHGDSVLFPPGVSAPGAGAPPAAAATAAPAGSTPAPTPSGPVAAAIAAAAQKYGVDPNLALSIARAESALNPVARSPKGAIGTMQLMPGTASDLGVDPTDPAQNIDGGVRYIKQLSDRFHGDPRLIAAAYNAGPGAVAEHGGVPPYPETQAYVQQVTGGASPYQVASLGATPGPPSAAPSAPTPPLPAGYSLYTPGGAAATPGAEHGHVSTAAELQAAGLPAGTQAWTNAKGEVGDVPAGLAAQGLSAATPNASGLTGIAFLHTLDPQTQALVLAFDQGRAPLPTGAALRNPVIAKAFAAAAQYDPNFDGATYAARQRTRTAFTSGVPAANVTAANTAIDHMVSLDQAIDGLHNGSVPAGNWAGNLFSQAVGQPNVDRFNAAKTAVASELARVFQGGAPHQTEIDEWDKKLDAAKSPAQLHAVVSEMATLLASRVNELGDQYNAGMGRTQDGLDLLRPQAAGSLARLAGADGRQAAAKASYYQQGERLGMAPSEIAADWQKIAQRYTTPAAPTGGGSAPAPGAEGAAAPTGAGHLTDAQLRASLGL